MLSRTMILVETVEAERSLNPLGLRWLKQCTQRLQDFTINAYGLPPA